MNVKGIPLKFFFIYLEGKVTNEGKTDRRVFHPLVLFRSPQEPWSDQAEAKSQEHVWFSRVGLGGCLLLLPQAHFQGVGLQVEQLYLNWHIKDLIISLKVRV